MISHCSQMDDENMTYDVSEENGSIICRRLYVLMCLSFFFLLRLHFTIPSTFINDLFLSRWNLFLSLFTSRKKIKFVVFISESSHVENWKSLILSLLVWTRILWRNHCWSSDSGSWIWFFEKFAGEKRINDMYNKAKNNCYFFVLFGWMILFVAISNTCKRHIKVTVFFVDFIFFDRVQRNLIVWGLLKVIRRSDLLKIFVNVISIICKMVVRKNA